jgi:hypothetical protein
MSFVRQSPTGGICRHAGRSAPFSDGIPGGGIDLSREAVERARSRAGGLEVTFLAGDMREAPGAGPWDGAYCFGNSFGYLSHHDTLRFVRNLFAAMVPGGRWVIDTGTAAEVPLA